MKGSRPPKRRGSIVARSAVRAFLAAAIACGAATTAAAAGMEPAARTWYSVGLLSGATIPDARLADYQWQVTPDLAWGAQARAGRGPWSAGLRWWSAATTQDLGIPGTPSPTVRWSSLEVVGRGPLATFAGQSLSATASTGWLHLGYRPDRVTLQVSGTPVEVEFAPVDAWILGAGLALERPIHREWTVGLEVDRRFFALDTAHRNGNAIEIERESFGDWSARLEVAWLKHRR
jgi:hypothetical protein